MLLALSVTLLALAAPPAKDKVPAPPSGPNPFVAQAKDLYGKLEFEKCLKRIAQASQWRSTPKELTEIELFAGLCSFGMGQKPDAEERFKQALRIDANAELPPYTSPRAVELFLKVKKSLVPKPPPLPDKDLPPESELKKGRSEVKPEPKAEPKQEVVEAKPEPKPEVVEAKPEPKPEPRPEPEPEPVVKHSDTPTVKKLTPKPKSEPDLVAAPGPGAFKVPVGGVVMTGVAAAALGFGIGFGASTRTLEGQARAAPFESDFLRLKSQAEGNAIAADIFFATAGTAAAVAVVLWVTGN